MRLKFNLNIKGMRFQFIFLCIHVNFMSIIYSTTDNVKKRNCYFLFRHVKGRMFRHWSLRLRSEHLTFKD